MPEFEQPTSQLYSWSPFVSWLSYHDFNRSTIVRASLAPSLFSRCFSWMYLTLLINSTSSHPIWPWLSFWLPFERFPVKHHFLPASLWDWGTSSSDFALQSTPLESQLSLTSPDWAMLTTTSPDWAMLPTAKRRLPPHSQCSLVSIKHVDLGAPSYLCAITIFISSCSSHTQISQGYSSINPLCSSSMFSITVNIIGIPF